ncbi:MAG TPA: response regulator transcription factor [Acidimicrobiales bacterium]|nr:response regulator transcription factor [Acidimicrobiales bacterium]
MSTGTVLVIDDDPALRRVMKIALGALGYDVVLAASGVSGLSEAALRSPAAVVLDLGLPDMDGVEICRRLREWTDVPVIVLSADATEDRKIEALDSGADDYVTKPFSMGELQARLRVALRRADRAAGAEQAEPSEVIEVGPLRLDQLHLEAWLEGRPIELTRREFAFLAYLARNEGRVCTQHMILSAVWGPGYVRETQYLREYAYRLRRKLGDDDGTMLRTRPGIGYQLVAPDAGGRSAADPT